MVYGDYTERRILIYSRTTSCQPCTSRSNCGRSYLTPALITAQREIVPDLLLAKNAASIVSHLHATVVFKRRYRLYGVYFQRYGKFLLTYTVHVQYESKKKAPFPFHSVLYPVPFRFSSRFNRSGPFHSVHFRSNRLPRANSFSARHEFVCKIHCVRWRSIARLFSTTRSRDGFFLP